MQTLVQGRDVVRRENATLRFRRQAELGSLVFTECGRPFSGRQTLSGCVKIGRLQGSSMDGCCLENGGVDKHLEPNLLSLNADLDTTCARGCCWAWRRAGGEKRGAARGKRQRTGTIREGWKGEPAAQSGLVSHRLRNEFCTALGYKGLEGSSLARRLQAHTTFGLPLLAPFNTVDTSVYTRLRSPWLQCLADYPITPSPFLSGPALSHQFWALHPPLKQKQPYPTVQLAAAAAFVPTASFPHLLPVPAPLTFTPWPAPRSGLSGPS